MNQKHCRLSVALLLAASVSMPAAAGGGLLGIDHRLAYDDSGIWRRSNQIFVQDATALVVIAGALWEGDGSRLGHTFWQGVDSAVIGTLSANLMKPVFSRERPRETDNPDQWFQGHGHASFPSGEVALVSSAVTPFILEYREEHPAVYALELLPLYDAVARVKVRGHWQSDVLASFALGSAIGYYAHERPSPVFVGILPRGVTVGLRLRF